MTNTIRTPRQGVTANSRRIAQAVDNEEWQEFRVSMKGSATRDKLDSLEMYWKHMVHDEVDHMPMRVSSDCDVCIRIDNYLKALMRGGQLTPFLSLSYFVNCSRDGKWRDVMTSEIIDGLRRQVSVIRK